MKINKFVVVEKVKIGWIKIIGYTLQDTIFNNKEEAQEFYDMVDIARGSRCEDKDFIKSKFEIVKLTGETSI